MMDAKGGIELSQFPKEAANLHALIDESLGSADAVAVQMAQRTVPRVLPSSAHQQRLAAASQIPLTARPAFPPKGWTPGSQAGDSEADVKKVMEKLRRVKSFAHNAKALHSVHPTSKYGLSLCLCLSPLSSLLSLSSGNPPPHTFIITIFTATHTNNHALPPSPPLPQRRSVTIYSCLYARADYSHACRSAVCLSFQTAVVGALCA